MIQFPQEMAVWSVTHGWLENSAMTMLRSQNGYYFKPDYAFYDMLV